SGTRLRVFRVPPLFATTAAAQATILRTLYESIKRVMPLEHMLTPTCRATAHTPLDGQLLQIMIARISVTIPSKRSHPAPDSLRNWYDNASTRTPPQKKKTQMRNAR